ncbi:MAG: GDSL-type esterase/lipase family protein [Chitinophagaceae bacterium]
MQKNSSRRTFLAAATGFTAGLLPLSLSAEEDMEITVETTSPDKGLVFLFQGDSITDGNRGRNTDPNHIMGHGYAFSIASRVGADFPAAGYTFFNRGISGNTIPDLQHRWQADTLNIQPDVLSILIGINDTAAFVENRPAALDAADFESGYRKLLESAIASNPAILFVLGLPFVYAVGKRKENWQLWSDSTAQRAEKVKKLATDFNAVLIDYPSMFDKAIYKAPADYWIWDGIHPTVPAHELMAREWIRQTSGRLKFLKRYV